MRWYFAIDEDGALCRNGPAGEDAKTAVLSALAVGGLEPCLLYYGARNEFTGWMERHGVRVIDAKPGFLEAMRAAELAGIYKPHSIGHWLRVEIPTIEQAEEFVLYTDCDVIFLKPVAWHKIRPLIFAAAPEFKPDNWNYFNAGVMVMNVPAMRASYGQFEQMICAQIASQRAYDDQVALNEAYKGHWERLPAVLNWKPYWAFNQLAGILHFHGPKLGVLEAIAKGGWHDDDPTARQWRRMVEGHIDNYIGWASQLGDQLQQIDLALALRFNRVASALLRHRAGITPQSVDTGFMNFCLFG